MASAGSKSRSSVASKKQVKHAFSATMGQISVQDVVPQRIKNPSLNRLKSMEMNDVTVTLVDDVGDAA